MTSGTGAAGARRRPNRIHSLNRPNTRRRRFRNASRAVFGWGGWTKLASIVTTVAAVTALWFTSQSLRATSDQYGLARQTAVTDRFSKAVEQLGNKESLDVRIGGIYSLERLAADSPADRGTIFEVLGAFVRGHAPNGAECGKSPEERPTLDVKAVLTVVGRRAAGSRDWIDLSNACLSRAEISFGNFRGVVLSGSNLMNAKLLSVDFTSAFFDRANLAGAQLHFSDLRQTQFVDAVLEGAQLGGSQMNDSRLLHTDLRGVSFGSADVRGATFNDVDLRGAKFGEAPTTGPRTLQVFGADALKGAVFLDVVYDESTYWPKGYSPPPARVR